MLRSECMRALARLIKDELVICCLGRNCHEWWAASESEATFYMRSAMGQASSMGFGLAMAFPHRRVWVLDGDGALAMNLGTLLTLADNRPKNLCHLVFCNRAYESSGKQRLINADQVDFAELARVAGWPVTLTVRDPAQLEDQLPEALQKEGPVFVSFEIEPTATPGKKILMDTLETKYMFARYLERTEGISVLGHPG